MTVIRFLTTHTLKRRPHLFSMLGILVFMAALIIWTRAGHRITPSTVMFQGKGSVLAIEKLSRNSTQYAIQCAGETRITIIDSQELGSTKTFNISGTHARLLCSLSETELLLSHDTGFDILSLIDGRTTNACDTVVMDSTVLDADGPSATFVIADSKKAVIYHRNVNNNRIFEDTSTIDYKNLGPGTASGVMFSRLVDFGRTLVILDNSNGKISSFDAITGNLMETASLSEVLDQGLDSDYGLVLSVAGNRECAHVNLSTTSCKLFSVHTSPFRVDVDVDMKYPFRPAEIKTLSDDGKYLGIVPFVGATLIHLINVKTEKPSFVCSDIIELDHTISCSAMGFADDAMSVIVGCTDGSVRRFVLSGR